MGARIVNRMANKTVVYILTEGRWQRYVVPIKESMHRLKWGLITSIGLIDQPNQKLPERKILLFREDLGYGRLENDET